MAIPKPQPKDWLAAAADELRQGDRAVLTLLQESYRNVNTILKGLPDTPDAAFGNLIYRAQLERTRRELLDEQAKLFDKLGDKTSARRLRSASRAAKLSAASDAALLNLVGQDEEGKRLYDGAKITAQRTVETLLARAKLSAVPLSERIYNTKSWMNKRLDRLIAQTMAGGLNASKFAKVARDWFSPSVPGGTRYAAMRLARTEINNAFHATSIVYAQDKPWVSQMEWHLSKSHPKPDACNTVAAASPYDVYAVPRKPHPQCMCYVTEVTPSEDEWIDRFVNGEFNDYLDGELAKADEALGIKPTTPKAPKTKKQQQKPEPAKESESVKLPSAAKAVDVPADNSAVELSVRQAYVDLAAKPGDLVRLADLRAKLNDVSKRDLDQALLKLDRERKIQLEPDPDRRNLTAADKAAAIPLGGEDMHLLVIEKKDLEDLLPTDLHPSPPNQIRKALHSGIKEKRKLTGGVAAETDLLETNDGTKLVRKTMGGEAVRGIDHLNDPKRQADAEELSSLVLQAMGGNAPSVVRDAENQITMEFIDGAVPSFEARLPNATQDKIAADLGPAMALFDTICGNVDRNPGNWMVKLGRTKEESGVYPIDHGFAFGFEPGHELDPSPYYSRFSQIAYVSSPFWRMTHLGDGGYAGSTGEWRDNDFSPADIQAMRKILESLRPEFVRTGRLDWYEISLRRLEAFSQFAKGTELHIK